MIESAESSESDDDSDFHLAGFYESQRQNVETPAIEGDLLQNNKSNMVRLAVEQEACVVCMEPTLGGFPMERRSVRMAEVRKVLQGEDSN